MQPPKSKSRSVSSSTSHRIDVIVFVVVNVVNVVNVVVVVVVVNVVIDVVDVVVVAVMAAADDDDGEEKNPGLKNVLAEQIRRVQKIFFSL